MTVSGTMCESLDLWRLGTLGFLLISTVFAVPIAPQQSPSLSNSLLNLTTINSMSACRMFYCPSQDQQGADFCQVLNPGCTHCKRPSSFHLPWEGPHYCVGEWLDRDIVIATNVTLKTSGLPTRETGKSPEFVNGDTLREVQSKRRWIYFSGFPSVTLSNQV